MGKTFLSMLGWTISVGQKFFLQVPKYTLVIVVASIIEQISQLLVFFLPLKVIILLGSEHTPAYFPQMFHDVERSDLVILLASLSCVFYLIYLFSGYLINRCSEKGASLLIERSRKITLFDNQHQVAINAYERYSRSLSGLIFVMLSLLAISLIYPNLALSVAIVLTLIILVVLLLVNLKPDMFASFDKNISNYSSIFSAIAFLIIFGYMVYDFLEGSAPGVLRAVISLLLVRQLLNKLSASLKDVYLLHGQKIKINALFFHNQRLEASIGIEHSKYWNMFKPNMINTWLYAPAQISESIREAEYLHKWYQTGVTDVVGLTLNKNNTEINYLIKLFNTTRLKMADHEASLLMAVSKDFPSPELLDISNVQDYRSHYYKVNGLKNIEPTEFWRNKLDVLKSLIRYEPNESLVEQYKRSHLGLGDKFNNEMIERLSLINNNSTTSDSVSQFSENLERLKDCLSKLPLQIITNEISHDTLKLDNENKVCLTSWCYWTIAPIGAGWPADSKHLPMLDQVFTSENMPIRKGYNVTNEELALSAISYALEQCYSRSQYMQALSLLPEINQRVESISSSWINSSAA